MSENIIETKGLTRDFITNKPGGVLRAVDQITLSVPPGIVFGFLGPNGSGKTTTIRLLLGLLEPTQGQASVFGFDTRSQAQEIRERTGALLEHTGLYERLNAEDNLEFYGRVYHMPTERRQARIRELLDRMGLWERRRETVGGWSRGMKQKLAVARALMHNPSLIFLDEPTAGLDPVASASLRDDLSRLVSEQGVTVFLTTHNLAEAEKLCQQVAVIRSGKLLASGSPADLRKRGGSTRTEVVGRGFTPELIAQLRARPEVLDLREQDGRLVFQTAPSTEFTPIVTMLVMGGAQVEEVRKDQASLEQIFLDLVE